MKGSQTVYMSVLHQRFVHFVNVKEIPKDKPINSDTAYFQRFKIITLLSLPRALEAPCFYTFYTRVYLDPNLGRKAQSLFGTGEGGVNI